MNQGILIEMRKIWTSVIWCVGRLKPEEVLDC